LSWARKIVGVTAQGSRRRDEAKKASPVYGTSEARRAHRRQEREETTCCYDVDAPGEPVTNCFMLHRKKHILPVTVEMNIR
jgi:hypothetical protein